MELITHASKGTFINIEHFKMKPCPSQKKMTRVRGNNITTDNPVFYENLVQNYIYKGPVEEWYIRIKVKILPTSPPQEYDKQK